MATTPAKVLPPAAPSALIDRPRLDPLLDEAAQRRLAAVVAGAGYGKSTLLAGWAATRRATWYTLDERDRRLTTLVDGLMSTLRLRVPSLPPDLAPAGASTRSLGADDAARAEAVASRLAEALAGLRRDLVLVLDDVHVLEADSPPARLVEGLCRQAPATFHLVLCSRDDPPFPLARLRGKGEVVDLGADALAFDRDETSALLKAVLGEAAEFVDDVQALTGGWPAAVRLAAEALAGAPTASRASALTRLRTPSGPLYHYLAEEVLSRLRPDVPELLGRLAALPRFSPELCAALGLGGTEALLDELARRGLVQHTDASYVLTPLVQAYAAKRLSIDPQEAARLRREAGAWFAAHGQPADALDVLAAGGEWGALAERLAVDGPALVAAGEASTVLRAADALPAAARTAQVEEIVGVAHHASGGWDEALAAFRRAARPDAELPARVAWRMGLVLHLRGELDEAIAVYERGRVVEADPDSALLLAWTASAHWLRGDVEACRRIAGRAHAEAAASGDDAALAAAHTTLALLAAIDGDRRANDAHYLRALAAAERSGDPLQLIRIRTNRGSRFLEEGAFTEALAELDIAVQLSELSGFSQLLGLTLANRGHVNLRLGALDDAQADFERAIRAWQQAWSRLVALPLAGLADVYRERGELVRAEAAYREALGLAEQAGDPQSLAPALAGLARTIAGEDPDEAAALVARALDCGPGLWQVEALLGAGWVALAGGDATAASRYGGEALAVAGGHRDRPGQAEALELLGLAADEPGGAGEHFREAAALWEELGSPIGAARVAALQQRVAPTGDGADADRAADRLRAFGVRLGGGAAGPLLAIADPAPPAVAIQSLGGFRVLRHGAPVPLSAWGSRKARDLLKMLVARHDRPVPRDVLCELLWPDEGDRDLASRLSVLLSTMRGVLDPDKRLPIDHFVRADQTAVTLDGEHVHVDAAAFLSTARAGMARWRAGDRVEARRLLAEADELYRGEFLEEDPYADWAVAPREELRATAIGVARVLAEDAADRGMADEAVRALLRLLSWDAFDEGAHLQLVGVLLAADRRGEAHRRYRLYVERMAELGVEAAPFPENAAPSPGP